MMDSGLIMCICFAMSMASAALSWNISYMMKSRGWYYMTTAFALAGYNRAAMDLGQPYYITRLLWILVSLLLMSGLLLIRVSIIKCGKSATKMESDLETTRIRLKDG